jgi:PilZ domain-containing protein
LIIQGRGTRLRYRFVNLEQARAHVHDRGGRAVFFVRDEKVRFLPDAPVCISFTFDAGEVPRLLHGRVAGSVEGTGTWLELLDTRPLRELAATGAARRSVRLGCDATVEARSEKRIASGRMLDLSVGGARLSGIDGFVAGDRVELRLLSPDRLTFHDLSYAQVMWSAEGHMGVQFDRSDIVGRHAVARLIAETEQLWGSAWEGLHPPSGCDGQCVVGPPPPHREQRAASGG